MSRLLILLMLAAICGSAVGATPRDWTDPEGRFLIRGEAFATNENTVVVKKENGDLVGVRIDQLSQADQEFLQQREAERRLRDPVPLPQAEAPVAADEQLQTWTSRDGFTFKGSIIGFGRRDITIRRVTRLIDVNGVAFTNLDPVTQYIVLQIVAELDDPSVQTERDLDRWVRRQGGQPRTFTVEGVLLRLTDGSNVPVPFFVFSEQDQSVLRPGWEQWQDEQTSDVDRQREDFLTTVQADHYHQEREQARQIQMMQLELMAAGIGLTRIWEVQLIAVQGRFARPLAVMVSARDSFQAQQMAMARFPGYVAGTIRAVTP
jgi:hypothetical protein